MRKMGKACGKTKFSQSAFNHLRDLGIDIDAERQPLVFDGGFVGRDNGQKGKVKDASQSYAGHRSEAGPRKGQRARTRPGPARQAESLRSVAHETAFGDQFRILAHHYEALAFEDPNGLWVAVKTRPLGRGGPQVHLLVALPFEETISPRTWAFEAIGNQAELFPLKHTNFPDASVCAFTKESGAWEPKDGLTALLDHYSLWIIKSWHRTHLDLWPGPQVGACAYYRRQEFKPDEWCGCESGKRYFACHQYKDIQVADQIGRRQFRELFSSNYEDRAAPQSVMLAARSRWKILPDMAAVFILRHAWGESRMPLS
ncbi:hypothetical protein [Altererythrobacter sp. C41]|uniref:hypothetical protein n=1 Tax=Altererythrobacter sp. C41 TaxID=2806021 RepID=UPI00193355CA|nr:hypothetical protein [Altererythrobacter sp. C41]MBM0169434.1 hypothetical protein [Altererythrobacter sp. C41]